MRPQIVILLIVLATRAAAATFALSSPSDDVIGKTVTVKASTKDTLSDLARRHDTGYEAMRRANPNVDPWLPRAGTPIVVPERHVLPAAPRTGIVLNLAEFRLYYYPPRQPGTDPVVMVFPVGIGLEGAPTPVTETHIVARLLKPTWYPPASIRTEHAADQDPLPHQVPAGPANPLGGYALQLALPGYFIHGTNRPYGIGMRVSHGCIRLYPEDIKTLFNLAHPGTPVNIVNQPYKAGWYDGRLYFEARPPLGINGPVRNATPAIRVALLAAKGHHVKIDWDKVARAAVAATGIPVAVSP